VYLCAASLKYGGQPLVQDETSVGGKGTTPTSKNSWAEPRKIRQVNPWILQILLTGILHYYPLF